MRLGRLEVQANVGWQIEFPDYIIDFVNYMHEGVNKRSS